MSVEKVEEFFSLNSNNAALVSMLSDSDHNQKDFAEKVISEASAQGFEFSSTELAAWVLEWKPSASTGELSDTQLEGVAGGGGTDLAAILLALQANNGSNRPVIPRNEAFDLMIKFVKDMEAKRSSLLGNER